MAKNDSRGCGEGEGIPAGPMPAVPPPDNPLERHRQESDVDDREAARLRVEAILRLRRAVNVNDEPEEEGGS